MSRTTTTTREELAARYLHGCGIEIGALQKPLRLPDGVKVEYVDRLTAEAARKEFVELDGIPIVSPTIITDADTLSGIADNSYDFCVSCNVVEHIRDPIGAVLNWFRVLKPAGVLFLECPNYENFMDKLRPPTSMEHLVADHEDRASRTLLDRQHFFECVNSTHDAMPEDFRMQLAEHYIDINYAVHFHTFDEVSFRRFLTEVRRHHEFEMEEFHVFQDPAHAEFVAILRKSPGPERSPAAGKWRRFLSGVSRGLIRR